MWPGECGDGSLKVVFLHGFILARQHGLHFLTHSSEATVLRSRRGLQAWLRCAGEASSDEECSPKQEP